MKNWFEIKNAGKAEPAEILLYGEIGTGWDGSSGVDAKAFAAELDKVPRDQPITLRIHSPGGSVFDGLAIYNLLSNRRDQITARIDGVALSAASFIAMAAKTIEMPKTGRMMIHDAQGFVVGDSAAMKEMAALLDRESNNIAAIYAARNGKTTADMRALMAKTTWMNGDEAKAIGLADVVTEGASVKNDFDLSRFSIVPERDLQNKSAPTGAGKNQPQIMNKDKMIALLNKWGVNIPDNATDEQLTALVEAGKPEAKASPAPAADAGIKIDPARIVALEAELKKQKEQSITDRFNQIAATRPQVGTNREKFLPKCLSDESMLDVYAAFPETPQPFAHSRPIITGGKSAGRQAIEAKAEGRERFEFLKNNWAQLAQGGVPVVPIYNANTIDAALTTDMLASGLILVLQNRLPALAGFTRDFGTDRMKPEATVQVGIITAGGTAQTNATDFEDATNFVGTKDNVAVTVDRITSGSHLTPVQLNSGHQMSDWVMLKANELADKIQTLVNAVINTANFTADPVVSAAGAFGHDELGSAWEAIAKSSIKNIMLHQSYWRRFLPTNMESFNPLTGNTMPGWDGFFLNTMWTGAEANTYGFAANPQAIAIAAGLPLASPNREAAGTTAQVITLPGINLSVEQQQWYSNKTKTDWANWEVMFGAAKGDGTAGVLIKSQA